MDKEYNYLSIGLLAYIASKVSETKFSVICFGITAILCIVLAIITIKTGIKNK